MNLLRDLWRKRSRQYLSPVDPHVTGGTNLRMELRIGLFCATPCDEIAHLSARLPDCSNVFPAWLTDCSCGKIVEGNEERRTASVSIGMGQKFLFILCCCGVALSQNPELGRVERNGNEATLIVDGPRPVDSAASTLAKEFGIRVNVEDPAYIFRDDVKDVTADVSRSARIARPILIPKGGNLEVHFVLGSDGIPLDIQGVLRSLVDAANAQFPFQYRLDADGNWFTIIPARTRDQLGNSVPAVPLLDRHVTIPPGTRAIMQSASLMTDALSAQTGLRVSCCQTAVAGIPWGFADISLKRTTNRLGAS